jgi:hypothetical protein
MIHPRSLSPETIHGPNVHSNEISSIYALLEICFTRDGKEKKSRERERERERAIYIRAKSCLARTYPRYFKKSFSASPTKFNLLVNEKGERERMRRLSNRFAKKRKRNIVPRQHVRCLDKSDINDRYTRIHSREISERRRGEIVCVSISQRSVESGAVVPSFHRAGHRAAPVNSRHEHADEPAGQ